MELVPPDRQTGIFSFNNNAFKVIAHTTWQVPGAAVRTGPGAAVVVATVSVCEKASITHLPIF